MYDFKERINARLKGEDPDEAPEQEGPKGVKTQGPQRFRHITPRQQARAAERLAAGQYRKKNRKYRKAYFVNALRTSVLRAQLQAVGKLEYADPDFVPSPGLAANAGMALEKRYGSADEALEHYLKVTGDDA